MGTDCDVEDAGTSTLDFGRTAEEAFEEIEYRWKGAADHLKADFSKAVEQAVAKEKANKQRAHRHQKNSPAGRRRKSSAGPLCGMGKSSRRAGRRISAASFILASPADLSPCRKGG